MTTPGHTAALWSLACRHHLGRADWHEAERVGLALLLGGTDSEGVVELASVTSRTGELTAVIEAALTDFKMEPPDGLQAGHVVMRDIAEAIVAGELDPYPGARQLWEVAQDVPELEQVLRRFINLANDWEDVLELRRQLESDIRSEAREFLATLQ